MKRKNVLFLALAALAMGLASCNNVPPASSQQDPSSSVSQSESGPVESTGDTEASVPSQESQTSAESSNVPTPGDENWVDYAHDGSVKLGLDFKGRNFYVDGIEEVELSSAIDGDTAHFSPKSGGELIKARFYGIDTPESTGKVQDYGPKASKYTKKILNAAKENGTIVVSSAQSTYGEPQPDSTGSRYVSLIWVNTEKKDAGLDELYLLNLMIVQEGLSWVKNVQAMPEYAPTFYAAENQAKEYKLMLHSGIPDDDINHGDYVTTSLWDLKQEIVAQQIDIIDGKEHDNKFNNVKARVQGTVSGFANHILYIQDFFPEYDENGMEKTDGEGNIIGEYAGLNIFCGMGSVPSKYTKPGTYIEVCGLCLDSQFGFQMTDVSLPKVSYADNDAQVILKAEENLGIHQLKTFHYTIAELNNLASNKNFEALFCHIVVDDVVELRAVNAVSSSSTYLYVKNCYDFSIYFTFSYQPYPETDPGVTWDAEKMKEYTYHAQGILGTHTTTAGKFQFQLVLRTSSDLALIEE